MPSFCKRKSCTQGVGDLTKSLPHQSPVGSKPGSPDSSYTTTGPRASPFPTTLLHQASQIRNSPTGHDLGLLETLHVGAQIHGEQAHQGPVLSYDRWVELQHRIATGDL